MEYRKHFYITLFSNGSQKMYAKNSLAEFTIQLAQPTDLGSPDNWEVGLCEFSCPPPVVGKLTKPLEVIGATNALVYCYLIAPQFVANTYIRCLRTFIHGSKYCDQTFKIVYYVPVEKRTFQNLTITVADMYGKPIPFKTSAVPTKVDLHFWRV
jgi:hypothetical protein